MYILVKKEGTVSTEDFYYTQQDAFNAFDRTAKSKDGFVAVFSADEGEIIFTRENSLAWK